MAEAKSTAVAAALEAERRTAKVAPNLAAQIADAAAAQLLIADDLPEDERPRAGDRVLLLGLVWGGTTLVELEQVAEGESLRAGRLFDLPASDMPRRFRVVQPRDSRHILSLPDGL